MITTSQAGSVLGLPVQALISKAPSRDPPRLELAPGICEWGRCTLRLILTSQAGAIPSVTTSGLPDRFGVYDIVEDVLTLDWDTSGFTADLAGASCTT
jgi:hypothetical protein